MAYHDGNLQKKDRQVKLTARILHRVYRTIIKVVLQASYDFQVWREGDLPSGPKIYCSNHFSSSDAHFVTTLMPEPLHMVIGPGFSLPIVKNFLTWTEQIPAYTKKQKQNVVARAVSALQEGDSIYIFPEGGLNTVEELISFRPGVARIYLEHPCPIVPIGLIAPKRRLRKKKNHVVNHAMTVVSRNYYANIGQPMEFPEALELAKTDRKAAEDLIILHLKEQISFLVSDIKNNKFWS